MKIIQRTDKVSVLGLVCEQMALRVSEMENIEDYQSCSSHFGINSSSPSTEIC